MSDDPRCIAELSASLRALGCCVFTARDLEDVAELIRTGAAKRFVLVRIAEAVATVAELREAIEEKLPDWAIEADDGDALLARRRATAPRLVN
jgi:hypothetical protein